MSILTEARAEIKELQTHMAALQSKITCLEQWERQEKERLSVVQRSPRQGYCVFNPSGQPELWTVREKWSYSIKRFLEHKPYPWAIYEKMGYSLGPCIVKPVIKA